MARGALVQGFEVTASELEAYQTPTQLVKSLIQKAEFVNTGGVPITVSAWITPDSGTATSNPLKVINEKQVGDGQTYVAIELIGEYINTGGKLIVQASAVGLSLWVNGNTFKIEV